MHTRPSIALGRFAGLALAIAGILAVGQCSTARADGPRSAFDLPRSAAEIAESEAARRSTLPGPPPKLFTCSPDIEAFSRPELAEFWQIVQTAPSLTVMIDRIRNRFSPGRGIYFPIYFDACVDYGEGNGPQRHRTVIRDIIRDPGDAAIALPRVLVRVEVVLPVREHQQRTIAVELKPARF